MSSVAHPEGIFSRSCFQFSTHSCIVQVSAPLPVQLPVLGLPPLPSSLGCFLPTDLQMRIINLNNGYRLGSYHCEPGPLFVLIHGKALTPLSEEEPEAERWRDLPEVTELRDKAGV